MATPQVPCMRPLDIVRILEVHLRSPKLHQQVDALRAWIEGTIDPQMDRRTGIVAIAADMKTTLELFGKVFFGGYLQNVRFDWNNHLLRDKGALARTRHRGNGDINIQLDPGLVYEDNWAADSNVGDSMADKILSTLAHECIHALFHDVRHRYRPCNKAECQQTWSDELGTGQDVRGDVGEHGDAFCRVAKLVEDFAKERRIFECDLVRVEDAKNHLRCTGRMLTTETVEYCWPGKTMTARGSGEDATVDIHDR